MKKNAIKTMFLALGAIFLTTACSGDKAPEASLEQKTAYELYEQANAEIKNAGSISMDTNSYIEMNYGEENLNIEMSGTVLQVLNSETDIDMQLDMNTKILDQTMPMKAYYTDGIYYIDANDQKLKMPLPLEQALQQANATTISFPESAIIEQSATNTEDGMEISFTLDGSAVADIIDNQLGNLRDSFGLSDMNMSVDTVEITAVIDSGGSFKSTAMAFSFEIEVGEEKMSANCETSMDITQIGDITIEFPDDLDTYTEFEQ